MLVQAKNLYQLKNRWKFDFNYDKGEQRRKLHYNARMLNVLPVYSLFLGTPDWRGLRVALICLQR